MVPENQNKANRSVVVIPARYGSSRFPGKPLALIAGVSLLERVWRLARKAGESIDVVIATDDKRIEDHARAFGAEVVMTSQDCRNGSERVWEAINKLTIPYEVIVNLQGDTPLTPPDLLSALIRFMEQNNSAEITTPAVQLSLGDYKELVTEIQKQTGGTFVTMDRNSKALYFSRFPIPYLRQDSKVPSDFPLFKHIGVYAYRRYSLERYVSLEPSPLEQIEQLEQLRALENGMSIHVVRVDLKGRTLASVDHPHDIDEVISILNREGDVV